MRSAGAMMQVFRRHLEMGLLGLLLMAGVGLPLSVIADRSELDGTWMQLQGELSPVSLTSDGQAAVDRYIPLRDDPDLECRPASLTNIIGIPDPPFQIRLYEGHVEINYEYMDVNRSIPLGDKLSPEGVPYTVADHPHLGRSTGRYEGDELVIETGDPEGGFVLTRAAEGYPQSTQMRTREQFKADGDRLYVLITHNDPVNYQEPFTMNLEFIRVDFPILEFGCTVEAASYDHRL